MLNILLASITLATTSLADTTAAKSAILAADRNLAAASASRGPEAFLAALDPSAAVLFPGQQILRGPSAARSAFIARYGSPSSYAWTPVHAVVSTDGKFGCTTGYSRFANAQDSVKTPRPGIYITCWTSDAKGKWRIVGSQRDDSPAQGPVYADSAKLPGAPHSATVSTGSLQLKAAQDADSIFAMMGSEAAGPGPAFAKYAADDAMVLGGAEFPRGPAQIAAAFDGYPAERVISWAPERSLGAGTGGLAFTVGHSTSGPRPGKTGRVNGSKYLTVWRQEPDGRWLYIFDLGSSRPTS